MTEIRVLRAGDEAVLESVLPDAFDDPINATAAATFLSDPRHHISVAIDDGVVVGFVSAVHYVHPDKERPEMWINEVGVAASHRRQGIAGRLLAAVLDVARELDCSEAWVLTNRTNDAAMRLYASSGGEEADQDAVMFTFPLKPDSSSPRETRNGKR